MSPPTTDLPACPHLDCVTAELATTQAGLRLDVARDAQAGHRALEMLLGVALAAGGSAAPMVIELPNRTDKIAGAVPADYAGATLTVLDVSPFRGHALATVAACSRWVRGTDAVTIA